MKFFTLPLVLLLLSTAAQAQDAEQCRVPISVAPDIRGLSLRQSLEEVRAKFPRATFHPFDAKPDEAGVFDAELGVIDWPDDRQKYEGILGFRLRFTDGKLSGVQATYDGHITWPSIESFTAQLSKTLALPAAWQPPTNANPQTARVMYCDGFRAIAFSANGSYFLVLVDTTAEKLAKDRRAALEDKKRQAFKP